MRFATTNLSKGRHNRRSSNSKELHASLPEAPAAKELPKILTHFPLLALAELLLDLRASTCEMDTCHPRNYNAGTGAFQSRPLLLGLIWSSPRSHSMGLSLSRFLIGYTCSLEKTLPWWENHGSLSISRKKNNPKFQSKNARVFGMLVIHL